MTTEEAEQLVESAVHNFYNRLHDGQDVSTGERLRLEGKIDLLLEIDVINDEVLQTIVNKLYQQYFDQPVDPLFWEWQNSSEHFCLPFQMREAPVYKN